MSVYLGDYFSGCRVAGTFTTVTTTGAPTVLTGTAGSVCLIAYKLLPGDATGMSCSTAGITLATNCLGATGLNGFEVNTNSDPTFYSCGHDFSVILQGGTVGGTCVSGYTIALFSLKHRSGLRPQVHGRELAVTVGAAANINWAGVESCSNATSLSCTSTFQVTSLLNDVNKITNVSNIEQGVACTVWSSLRKNYGTCGTFGYLLDCSISSTLQPDEYGRKLAVTSTGEAGINWARVANCTTAQNLTCTRTFDVVSVQNNVPGVTAGVTVTTNNDKTGYALSAAGVQCVGFISLTEPANVPGWPMTLQTSLAWLAALGSNQITQTASTQTLCNRAVNSSISSAAITCTSTIVTRGTFGAVIP